MPDAPFHACELEGSHEVLNFCGASHFLSSSWSFLFHGRYYSSLQAERWILNPREASFSLSLLHFLFSILSVSQITYRSCSQPALATFLRLQASPRHLTVIKNKAWKLVRTPIHSLPRSLNPKTTLPRHLLQSTVPNPTPTSQFPDTVTLLCNSD